MKVILCFGDSNTWGLDPRSGERLPRDMRWPGVLARALGPGYSVVEEGLNDRTTNLDDPLYPHRNGAAQLPACLDSHRPLDLVILMLGTNDLKARFGRAASDIAESAASLAGVAKRSMSAPGRRPPEVLLVAPPAVRVLGPYAEMFAGAAGKAEHFGRLYALYASWYGAHSFDAATVVRTSDVDGIHLDGESHQRLGEALVSESLRVLR